MTPAARRFEAVVFDMDGVLIDSEGIWQQVREEFAADCGAAWTAADQVSTMGCNTAAWARIMVQRLNLRPRGLDAAAVAAEIVRRMQAKYTARLPLRPGALDAVRCAAGRWRVALATGSPQALAGHVLRVTGLDRVFEATVCGDDVEHGKPAPDIYRAVLARLGVRAEHAIGVEDSGNGIRALKAAGMAVIAAPSPGYPLSDEMLALADARIDEMTEFSAELVERVGGA